MQPTEQVVKSHQVARLLLLFERLRDRANEVAQQLRCRVGSGVDHRAGMPHVWSQQIPDPVHWIFAARGDQGRRLFMVQYPTPHPVLREPLQDLRIVLEERAAEWHPTLQRALRQHLVTETVNRGDTEVIEGGECRAHNRAAIRTVQVT